MIRLLRSSFVIARRDFAATVLSKAFIFFLLGPLFPLLLGGVFGSIGARVATQTARPVVAVVMMPNEAAQLAAARDRLADALGEQAVVQLVYFEPDEAFFLDIHRTRSRRYLVLELASHSTSEARYLSADDPTGDFRVVEPRRAGIEYSVTHHGDRFYIATNDGATNFRLVAAPVSNPGREHWAAVLPYRPDVKLDAVRTKRESVFERGQGVLGPQRRATTVGKDERTGCASIRKLGQGPHLSRGARCKMQICPPRPPVQPTLANFARMSPQDGSRGAASRTRFAAT